LYPKLPQQSPFTAIYVEKAILIQSNFTRQATFEITIKNMGNTSITWFNITLPPTEKLYNFETNPLLPNQDATLTFNSAGNYLPDTSYTYTIMYRNNYNQTFKQSSNVQCQNVP
jgi:hypothetical protein